MTKFLEKFILKNYKKILLISLLITIVAMYFTSQLKMNSQMMDMLPRDQKEVKTYKQVLENYQGIDNVILAIEGKSENIKEFIKNVVPEIEKIKDVGKVISKADRYFFLKNSLLLIKYKDLNNMKSMFESASLDEFIKGINDNFERTYINDGDSDKISKDSTDLIHSINSIEDILKNIRAGEVDVSLTKKLAETFFAGPEYMLSPDRTMGLVIIKTPVPMTEIDRIVPMVDQIEKTVKIFQHKYNVQAGITGMIVIQRDEMHVTENDMGMSSLVSLVLILLIFWIGFRLLRYSLLAIVLLIVGILWAMAITYILIGHLSIMTAMMGAILIGLGIDYSIHIISIFTEYRASGKGVKESISQIFKKSIKGIITGAITTALGFAAFGFSSFPGFSEFGIVLSIGIVSTLIASVFILPSILILFGKKQVGLFNLNVHNKLKLNALVTKYPYIIVVVIFVLTIVSVLFISRVSFTTDLKQIEPKGLESLAVNDKLIDKYEFSSDTSMFLTDNLKDVYSLKKELEDLKTVKSIDSVADYVPEVDNQKSRMKIINQIKKSIKEKNIKNVDISALKNELKRLRDNLIEISDLSYIGAEHKLVERCDAFVDSNIIDEIIADNKLSVSSFNKSFMGFFRNIIISSNTSELLTINDIPDNVRDSMIGEDGSFLTTIYPKGDVWSDNFQPAHKKELSSIKYPVTGSFILSSTVFDIAGRQGKTILVYVVIIIFVVLLIDFMSLKYALLAMIPMFLTLVYLLGIMGILGLKFNFVNIITLPIIIGIGVDDGVHLIHRYLVEKNIVSAIASTGKGILLTTLTTCAAFGSLMMASYRGFASFGLVLVIGVSLSYILTVLLVPSLLVILDGKGDKK